MSQFYQQLKIELVRSSSMELRSPSGEVTLKFPTNLGHSIVESHIFKNVHVSLGKNIEGQGLMQSG